jgi:protein transport protein SEC24
MAVVISPLGNGHPSDTPVPVLSYPDGPPRCTRCRAYINAYVRTGSNRNVFFCNFCSARNAMPVDVGSMSDLLQDRPELRLCAPSTQRYMSNISYL